VKTLPPRLDFSQQKYHDLLTKIYFMTLSIEAFRQRPVSLPEGNRSRIHLPFAGVLYERVQSASEYQVDHWAKLGGIMVTAEEKAKYVKLRPITPEDKSQILSDPELLSSILPDDRRIRFEAQFPHIFPSPFNELRLN